VIISKASNMAAASEVLDLGNHSVRNGKLVHLQRDLEYVGGRLGPLQVREPRN
jgi:hypothetical protein